MSWFRVLLVVFGGFDRECDDGEDEYLDDDGGKELY